jgi:hypothetical protein
MLWVNCRGVSYYPGHVVQAGTLNGTRGEIINWSTAALRTPTLVDGQLPTFLIMLAGDFSCGKNTRKGGLPIATVNCQLTFGW